MALTDKLTAIANAIRSKTGKTGTMTLEQMPMEIMSIRTSGSGGGGGLEPFALDVGSGMILHSAFLELLKQVGEGVVIEIKTAESFSNAFEKSKDIGFKIPDVVFYGTGRNAMSSMFCGSTIKAENLPKIVSAERVWSINKLFDSSFIEYVPADFFDNINCYFQEINFDCSYVFSNCYKLRTIPKRVLSQIYNVASNTNYATMNCGFYNCYVLNELDGIVIKYTDTTMKSNIFKYTFDNCHMLKRIVFAMNEDQPYVVKMNTQYIDLTRYVGYTDYINTITRFSNMTTENLVTDNASYNRLKDTEDWFTDSVDYSRYNRTSAVETINSLPDTSAYLASAGGKNTIKFKGASGALTDGGAINTMTAEEIAVAIAKGWTVAFA